MTTSLRGRALLEAALDRITNPGWMGDGVYWTGDDDDVDPSSVPTDLPPGDVHHVARDALGWDERTAARVFVYYPASLRDPERFAACVRYMDEHRDASWADALSSTSRRTK